MTREEFLQEVEAMGYRVTYGAFISIGKEYCFVSRRSRLVRLPGPIALTYEEALAALPALALCE